MSRDNLLLEVGFLCILVAPLTLIRGSRGVREHDRVTFWLLRWLLFRLMFASGVVKLTSRCPTWWGLTGVYKSLSWRRVFFSCVEGGTPKSRYYSNFKTAIWLVGTSQPLKLTSVHLHVNGFTFPSVSELSGSCLVSNIYFPLCVEQLWRITMRLSASPPSWPGMLTSCQCGGRSCVWWGPSSLRSPCPCSSSAHCADSDSGLFTCRWVESQLLWKLQLPNLD